MKNFVPLPYRRVAVRDAAFSLTERALRENLLGRESYRRTEFIVLRRGNECAIARVEKENPEELFSAISAAELFAPPQECCWIDDDTVDVGSPSQLGARARAAGLGIDRTVIVHGKYEHVNFIYHPDPIVIRVVDVVPPEPAKLWTMAQQVLAYAEGLPAVELRPEMIDLVGLARAHPALAYLFPCQASGIEVGAPIHFLDTRPEWREWTMIGCERCAQFHRHFYGREPVQVDYCPRKFTERRGSTHAAAIGATGTGASPVTTDSTPFTKGATPVTAERSIISSTASSAGELILTKCCLLETTIECEGNRAVVPWGANLKNVEEAVRYLVSQNEGASRLALAEAEPGGDC